MKASLNLCLLFSLISPVVLLRCQECLSLESTECFLPYDQYCAPNSSCINYLVELNAFRDFSEATKSCITPILCEPGYYSFTTTGGKFIKMLVECCRTKNCNSRPLKFSSQPMEPNGLECEGCHADRGRPCNNIETVKCLGDQTKCISMNITYMDTVAMKLRVFTTKGCATPIMCDPIKVEKSMEFGAVGVSEIIANCTDAVLSPEPSSLA